jgi:hypothetical protein
MDDEEFRIQFRSAELTFENRELQGSLEKIFDVLKNNDGIEVDGEDMLIPSANVSLNYTHFEEDVCNHIFDDYPDQFNIEKIEAHRLRGFVQTYMMPVHDSIAKQVIEEHFPEIFDNECDCGCEERLADRKKDYQELVEFEYVEKRFNQHNLKPVIETLLSVFKENKHYLSYMCIADGGHIPKKEGNEKPLTYDNFERAICNHIADRSDLLGVDKKDMARIRDLVQEYYAPKDNPIFKRVIEKYIPNAFKEE